MSAVCVIYLNISMLYVGAVSEEVNSLLWHILALSHSMMWFIPETLVVGATFFLTWFDFLSSSVAKVEIKENISRSFVWLLLQIWLQNKLGNRIHSESVPNTLIQSTFLFLGLILGADPSGVHMWFFF